MSRSTDPGHFFQSAAALDNAARKAEKSSNDFGNPIQLPSKHLAVIPDDFVSDDVAAVFVAEAAGLVKRVDLESNKVTQTFKPAIAILSPLTCLAISAPVTTDDGSRQRTLYAGSWDKSIYSWTLHHDPTGKIIKTAPSRTFTGHSDFVKALLFLPLKENNLLVSASADSTIIVWNCQTGAKLHTLQGHTRAVQALALDPLSADEDESSAPSAATFYSGDSNRDIRAWRVSSTTAHEVPASSPDSTPEQAGGPIDPLIAHETSIYALRFDASTGDLLTASADKTAKLLSRAHGFATDTEFAHPDFVRDVAFDGSGGMVVTACRDEEVRVWDRGSGKCVHVYDGHFEEVTGLAVVKGGREVVSVGIDGTVRRWNLSLKGIEKAREEKEKRIQGVEAKKEEETKESMLTAEEEAELAELMDDDDD